MKLCPYCNKKISFFGTTFGGIEHTKCNSDAEKHKSFVRSYVKNEALSGRFNKIAPNEFNDAQKYFSNTPELEESMAAGFDDAVEEMCDDVMLDDKELNDLENFINDLTTRFQDNDANEPSTREYVIKMLSQYGALKTIADARTLYQLRQGIAPNIQPPAGLMLNKNETFIYYWGSVQCSTLNVKTKFRGRSTGGSYRISKKFSIRHTEHRGRPVSYSEWNNKGSGVLAITNKHIFFLGDGDKGDVKERFSRISSIDPTSDGFIVNLDLKTRPAVRFTISGTSRDAWFASNIVLAAPTFG